MRKIVAVLAGSLILSGTAFMGTANAAVTHKSGPFASNSTDSGTCGGPDWANDTAVNRTYTVYTQQSIDGSYRVTESFTKGHFITYQGNSPESCEAATSNQVSAGVKGTFSGTFTIKVSGGGPYNQAAADACAAPCYTASFILAAFGGSATFDVPDFYFHYITKNPAACAKEWTNAATGDGGDIATICSP